MTALGVVEGGGVLRIDLPGTPLDAALATALLEVLPAEDDLEAPAVLLVAGTPDGRFAPLDHAGGDRAGGGARAGHPQPPPPVGLRDGGPGGAVARCIEALAAFDGVVVAALTGDAAGCGAELALACDLRVVAEPARLHLPHVAHGLVPACGATQRLPRLCGPGAAARMLLLAEPVGGAELCRLGLAITSCPTARETLDTGATLAARLAAQAPNALRACREAMRAGADLPLREGLRLEADLAVLLQTTTDRPEGIRAFLEKRTPRFTGS